MRDVDYAREGKTGTMLAEGATELGLSAEAV